MMYQAKKKGRVTRNGCMMIYSKYPIVKALMLFKMIMVMTMLLILLSGSVQTVSYVMVRPNSGVNRIKYL